MPLPVPASSRIFASRASSRGESAPSSPLAPRPHSYIEESVWNENDPPNTAAHLRSCWHDALSLLSCWSSTDVMVPGSGSFVWEADDLSTFPVSVPCASQVRASSSAKKGFPSPNCSIAVLTGSGRSATNVLICQSPYVLQLSSWHKEIPSSPKNWRAPG